MASLWVPVTSPVPRRYAIGAEVQPSGGTHFRVWAPMADRVAAVLDRGEFPQAGAVMPLAAEGGGYFGAWLPVDAGARYWLQLDDHGRFADPASRSQPDGPHGPSCIVDPAAFTWTDVEWAGIRASAPVVYEMHIGTVTRKGTWAAATAMLESIATLGVDVIELMPVAEFPGRFGWGYDGVLLFAPSHLYGAPDDMRRFVDRAHALGLGVVLDVVYNHFGPDGCPLAHFSPDYFSPDPTEWGQAVNFDGRNAGAVRELITSNAGYWIDEFHLDGLRLDATQSIRDRSPRHIVHDIAVEVRRRGAGRRTWICAENEPQQAEWLRPASSADAAALDALWNDDFHHSAVVALTGHREAYYTDYHGRPQEFVSIVKHGFLYQGQRYAWQRHARGTCARGLPPRHFVCFLDNHDQVANSRRGLRMHARTSAGRWRAMTALLLLGPWSPLLFQGEEFRASAPFLYFADHREDLAAAVRTGRREFLAQFPSLAGEAAALPAPDDGATFEQCKLDWSERQHHNDAVQLHASLLALRRDDPAFHDTVRFTREGAVLGDSAFVLRVIDTVHEPGRPSALDRLLVINLGPDLRLDVVPEPLLSPYPFARWRIHWSSEAAVYGGAGVPDLGDTWTIPAESALVLVPEGAA